MNDSQDLIRVATVTKLNKEILLEVARGLIWDSLKIIPEDANKSYSVSLKMRIRKI